MKKRDDPEAMAAYRKKYNASEKGRESRRRYAATAKGREAQRRTKAHYNKTNAAAIRDMQKAIRRRKMGKVDAIKLARGCADCGYSRHSYALDFDHLDPATKSATVSQLVTNNVAWDVIEAEIAKCEVVCANCHRIRTFERRHHLRPGELPTSAPPVPSLFDGVVA